ncbi:MAG: hypothetical protein DRG87_08205 [Deltaproteobacteria bacterium]|nr:CoA-binding protein [Deltaproteobacteria bacterium]MBW2077634.1 CoA-binding protein [Deltaproteobacteria bacterium]MBW2310324.1 CoA-binding protein [Deltaproteobacteria bacterium]RLB28959.1 MAG: hypothetical protein DRG87_08205 [Deltaproteobacteria bacterium]
MKPDLSCFFEPKGIAVVGASPDERKGGCSLLKNVAFGYSGTIYPVNPRHKEVLGIKAYPSVSAIDGSADLALIFVPAEHTPKVLIHLFTGSGVWGFDPVELMTGIKDRKKPVFTLLFGPKDEAEQGRRRMESRGWPVFLEVQRLVKVMSFLL